MGTQVEQHKEKEKDRIDWRRISTGALHQGYSQREIAAILLKESLSIIKLYKLNPKMNRVFRICFHGYFYGETW